MGNAEKDSKAQMKNQCVGFFFPEERKK